MDTCGSDQEVIGGTDEEDEEVTLTPYQVLQRLETGWINEKLSPQLLPPLDDERAGMIQQIQLMQNNIQGLNKNDMRTELHKLELERINFIVTSYIRTRLFKLENSVYYYYNYEIKRKSNQPSLLSREEFGFVKALIERTEEYWKLTILAKMPTPIQKFDPKKFKREPSLDAHVFFRVPQTVEDPSMLTFYVEDVEKDVELKEGEQHVMRYEPVSKLLQNNVIFLV